MKTFPLFLVVCAALLAAFPASAAEDSIITAVFSKVGNGYHRERMPDGSFKREYYALTKGTYQPGVGVDRSIDAVRYPQIAKIVAQFLATKNYYLAPDAGSATLLLSITWGKTVPFNDAVFRDKMDTFYGSLNSLAAAQRDVPPGGGRTADGIQSPAASVRDAASDEAEQQLLQMTMFESSRRQADEYNARLLGYIDEINARENPSQFAGAGDAYHELFSDIENERYYLILTAYDFRAAKQDSKLKPLWCTRVSVQAQGNRFNETVAAMLRRASRYFGQDSGRLVRQYEPEAHVIMGDLKFVGFVPDSEIDSTPPARKP